MSLAMVPLSRLAAGFPRLVRDLAGRAGKQVTLELEGQDVELDKRVLDAVGEALGHLVTNAVDHGCETPQARVAAGKPEAACVSVRARASGASVIIEVGGRRRRHRSRRGLPCCRRSGARGAERGARRRW